VSDRVIYRGQAVRWRMSIVDGGSNPASMTGGTWDTVPVKGTFRVLPTFEIEGTQAWVVWSPEQTWQMTTGRKLLRLRYTPPNGAARVYPDIYITVK
jgi:hypothetical protein